MTIQLTKATVSDSETIHKMQLESFAPLLEKYRDYDTNPGAEPLERVKQRFSFNADQYFVTLGGKKIGYFRVQQPDDATCRLSAMFILPACQGSGYAQAAIKQAEALYPNAAKWTLDTIKQEPKLRHLYEKLGYKLTGEEKNIKPGMDIVHYAKYVVRVKPIDINDSLWEPVAAYAQNCSWRAGEFFAKRMRENGFAGWERVFVALDGQNIAGYCALIKSDCIPDVAYSPYISFIFVGEEHRGKRVGEKMITAASQYAAGVGFDKVYIVSDHVNLYEKYGFTKADEKLAPWGNMQTIFAKKINW